MERNLLIRILKLESNLNSSFVDTIYKKLKSKLFGDPILEVANVSSVENICLLYDKLLEQTQQQLYGEQLKRIHYEETLKETKKKLNESTAVHNEYVKSIAPLIKTLTKKTEIYLNNSMKYKDELVNAKRDRDVALNRAKEMEIELGEERNKRARLRKSYRSISQSVDGDTNPNIKDALTEMKNALIN